MRARPVTKLRDTTASVFSATGAWRSTLTSTLTRLILPASIVNCSTRPTLTPRMLTSLPTCRPSTDWRSNAITSRFASPWSPANQVKTPAAARASPSTIAPING